MARQVMIITVCDLCKKRWQEGDEEAPKDYPWTWNGADYLSQLCSGCVTRTEEQWVKPLKDMSELRKKAGKRGPKPHNVAVKNGAAAPGFFATLRHDDGMYYCPAPGCPRSFGAPQHLGNHHIRQHFAQLTEETYAGGLSDGGL